MQSHTGAKIIPAQLQAFDVLTKRNRKPMILTSNYFPFLKGSEAVCKGTPERNDRKTPFEVIGTTRKIER